MDAWKYVIPTWYPRECSPFLGNGYFGGTVPIDGHGAGGNPYGLCLAAYYIGDNEDMPNLPHWLNVPLTVDGRQASPSWVGYQQTLDLERGLIETAYTEHGGSVRVVTRTFCHRGDKHIATYRMTITALKRVEIEASPQLNLSACYHKPAVSLAQEREVDGWSLNYGDAGDQAVQLMALECSANARRERFANRDAVGQKLRCALKPGQALTLRATVFMGAGSPSFAQAGRRLLAAHARGFAALEAAHAREMQAIWNGFQVESSDPFVTRRMRSAMFYLTCGYRKDVIFGGSASGLSSGVGWGGSVFWDTEFYMLPSLILTQPDLARNILLYRHATLGAAKRNALAHGERGARFAWQSKKTGRPFAGGFEDERHVTTDIAFSTWWYAQSTGDRAFLKGPGRAIIVEAARNVASRSWRNPAKDRYEIHGVIPADEHVFDHYVGAPVDNSAMTNAYAQWAMRAAAGLPGVDRKEAAQWRTIADKMYLPRDQKLGIYREYDGYDGHPIKQADIGHMFFPLCVDCDREEIRRNIYYYADRERETSLYLLHSPMVYGAALSRAGDLAGVQRFYKLTELNRLGPFELSRESNFNSGGPTVTGSGAFLTLMLHGVLGIENFSDRLTAHPCVPEEIGKLTVAGLHFQGARYAVSAAPGQGPTVTRM